MDEVTLLIFGCGYLGRRVARRFLDSGVKVAAVTRSAERARQLSDVGVVPYVADVADARTLADLPAASFVLFAVGFDRAAGRTMSDVYQTGLANVLGRAAPQRRLVYISTTGVHSGESGEWIDEESPCEPASEGAKNHWAAEQLLAAHGLADRAVVLRMAGLYGPGRIPRRDELVAGKIVSGSAEGFLNLIHVDDAAAVVEAAAGHEQPSRAYVVSDGHPVRRWEYLAEIARLLGAPPPRFDERQPATRRGPGNKRVNNARMQAELLVELAYPTYRDGLAAIVAGEGFSHDA
ncbi:MAG: NAD-dependent epimerase/dehydratase family protein [Pirellulales bacterium]